MADKFDLASQKVTPRDAQKGGQGAVSADHPETELRQDVPHAASPAPPAREPPSEGLSADQIVLLCEIGERDPAGVAPDQAREAELLVLRGYIEPLDTAESLAESLGPRFRLTAKGVTFLAGRGAGLNEA